MSSRGDERRKEVHGGLLRVEETMFGLGSPCVTNSSNLEDYSGTICMSCLASLPRCLLLSIIVHGCFFFITFPILQSYIPQSSHFHMTVFTISTPETSLQSPSYSNAAMKSHWRRHPLPNQHAYPGSIFPCNKQTHLYFPFLSKSIAYL